MEVESVLIEAFDGTADPLVGRDALRFSVELGVSYAALKESPAWRHLVRHVSQARERLVEQLLDDPVKNASKRDTVRFIDLMLKAPEKMIREGRLSAASLEHAKEKVGNG